MSKPFSIYGGQGSKFSDFLAQELSKPGAREITFGPSLSKWQKNKVVSTMSNDVYPPPKKEKPKPSTKAAPGPGKRKVILEDE